MPCSRRNSTSPNRWAVPRVDPVELHPPQQRPDPGGELLRHDGLGDVVVGARLEPGDEVVSVGLSGDDDDRHDARRAQGTAHVESRHVGETQVEQHEVGLVLAERGQPDVPSPASRTS